MKKALITVATVIVVLSLLSSIGIAATWNEDRSGVQFKVDKKTGNTQAGFYLFMNYDQAPDCIEIIVDWIVYPLSSPESPLATDSHRIRKHCGGRIASVSTLSPFITPVPGESYAGKIYLHDVANDLSYEKEITYVAPITLPTGIGINVTTQDGKTEEIDFSGVSEEQLNDLATYYAIVTESYEEDASGVSLSDFFTDYSGHRPQWIFVAAQLGPQIDQTGPGISIHASYNRLFFLYLIDEAQGAEAVKEQLDEFNSDFIGSALLAKGDAGDGAPQSVFMGDQAWKILQAAKKEQDRRG